MTMTRYEIKYDKVATSEGGNNLEDNIRDILESVEGFTNTLGVYSKKGVEFEMEFTVANATSTGNVIFKNVKLATKSVDSGRRGYLLNVAKDDNRTAWLYVQNDVADNELSVWLVAPFSIPKDGGYPTAVGYFKGGFCKKGNDDIVVAHSLPVDQSTQWIPYDYSNSRLTYTQCHFMNMVNGVDASSGDDSSFEDNLCQIYKSDSDTWKFNNYQEDSKEFVSGKFILPYWVSSLCYPGLTNNVATFSALTTSSATTSLMFPITLQEIIESSSGTSVRIKTKHLLTGMPYIYMGSPKDKEDGSDMVVGNRNFQIFTGPLDDGTRRTRFFSGEVALGMFTNYSAGRGGNFYQGLFFEFTTSVAYN